MKNRILALSLFLLCVITLLPFLGLTEFNTKGEPREAVVALSMLNQDNWILPVNNGVDIPYKPPFMHWCIALLSMAQGYVSEFVSRLPSALSLIVMVVCGFLFFAKRKNNKVAFIAALLTLTSIEVHRAAIVCRVDMMLTAFIVGALFLLYKWYERDCKGIPIMAVLCMSGAMCTKGPIGVALPLLVMGIFLLLRGKKFVPTVGKFVVIGMLALIIPLMWYIAAYNQGGDTFLELVKEENIDRLLGKMSYQSHENPASYNFMTVIVGWLPWTLLLIISLFSLKYHKVQISLRSAWQKVRNADSLTLFVWLSFIVIFVFYCIPKSKRSVYLLPIYPFMAYLIAEYLVYLTRDKIKPFKIYGGFLAFITMLVSAVFIFARCGMLTGPFKGEDFTLGNLYFFISENLYASAWAMIFPSFLIMIAVSFNKDKKIYVRSMLTLIASFVAILALVFTALNMLGPENMSLLGRNSELVLRQLDAIEHTDINFFMLLIMYIPLIVAFHIISILCNDQYKNSANTLLVNIFVLTFSIYIVVDGFYLPRILNTRCDRPLAEELNKKFADEQIYSYTSREMLYFFGTNFYMGDKIKQFEVSRPEHGILMIADEDREGFFAKYKDIEFKPVLKTKRKMTERKDIIYFYRF